MDSLLRFFLEGLPTYILIIAALGSILVLGKGADLLVEEAVSLSTKWGVPKLVIGATIVSLGTTLPEATVSVLAALQGNPDLALGNAIGSIITDTGLILGVAALVGTLPVDRKIIKTQGKVQIGVAFLLSIIALPLFGSNQNGIIYQWMGVVLLLILVLYIIKSLSWAQKVNSQEELRINSSPIILHIVKLFLCITVIILSSKLLIPSVEIVAIRIGIPQSIIAATIVAFGTSLPELMTAITSVRKGHGDLAIGNIIGADILNVLFVVGASAAVTSRGLIVPISFFYLQIPAMLVILLMFRVFEMNGKKGISKVEGSVLLLLYIIYIVLNYTWLI